MSKDNSVSYFTPYDFIQGEKITITDGPRRGDWEVLHIDDKKITLRCPVSGREFTWERFCFFHKRKTNEEWPHKD